MVIVGQAKERERYSANDDEQKKVRVRCAIRMCGGISASKPERAIRLAPKSGQMLAPCHVIMTRPYGKHGGLR